MENPKRHKHADLIHAWAEGAEIEVLNKIDTGIWSISANPQWKPECEYRIKPKKPEWWENIPKHGILVKSTAPCLGSNAVCCLLKTDTPEAWEPLTNEEIERFKR